MADRDAADPDAMNDPEFDLPALGFLRSRDWWTLAGRGVAMGAAGGLVALLFVGVVDSGLELLWSVTPRAEPLSGSWRILVILTIAGALVGWVHRLSPESQEINVFEGLVEGRVEPRGAVGTMVISLFSLIGGASLGPESPTGVASGAMATAFAERQGWSRQSRRSAVRCAVTSAWSGLFTSPYVSTLMTLELAHEQHPGVWPLMLIEVFSALVGFTIFFVAGGWAQVLRLLDVGGYDFRLIDIGWAVLVGFVGALGALLFVALKRLFARAAQPFEGRPLLRGVTAGVVLGLVGMALPLTLFNGAAGLVTVTQRTATIGIWVVLASAVAKLAATMLALEFGFVGGPIFPAMFAGGSFGVVLVHAFPGLPPVVAIAGGIAALPAALVGVPFSLTVLAMLIAGAQPRAALPVLTAVIVSVLLVRGLGRVRTAEPTAD